MTAEMMKDESFKHISKIEKVTVRKRYFRDDYLFESGGTTEKEAKTGTKEEYEAYLKEKEE